METGTCLCIPERYNMSSRLTLDPVDTEAGQQPGGGEDTVDQSTEIVMDFSTSQP